MRVLIATAMRPLTPAHASNVFDIMREDASLNGLTIPPGIWWTQGPGCTNLAFELVGPDDAAEAYTYQLTMALMPAKCSTTADPLPATDTVDV